jgi:hypothetical protein
VPSFLRFMQLPLKPLLFIFLTHPAPSSQTGSGSRECSGGTKIRAQHSERLNESCRTGLTFAGGKIFSCFLRYSFLHITEIRYVCRS